MAAVSLDHLDPLEPLDPLDLLEPTDFDPRNPQNVEKSALFERMKRINYKERTPADMSSEDFEEQLPCGCLDRGIRFNVKLSPGKGKHANDGAVVQILMRAKRPFCLEIFPEIPHKVRSLTEALFPMKKYPPPPNSGLFCIPMDGIWFSVDVSISYNQRFLVERSARKMQKKKQEQREILRQEELQRHRAKEQQRLQLVQQRKEEEQAELLAEANLLGFDTVEEMIAERKKKEMEAIIAALELKEKERKAEQAAEDAIKANKARADSEAKKAAKAAQQKEKFGTKKGSPHSSDLSRGSSTSPPPSIGGFAKK